MSVFAESFPDLMEAQHYTVGIVRYLLRLCQYFIRLNQKLFTNQI